MAENKNQPVNYNYLPQNFAAYQNFNSNQQPAVQPNQITQNTPLQQIPFAPYYNSMAYGANPQLYVPFPQNYQAVPSPLQPNINPALNSSQTAPVDNDDDSNYLELKHNSRYNLNPLLYDNILQSDYYHKIIGMNCLSDIITEAMAKVVHLEPTALGHTLLPSTAFCLLYKLFEIRLSKSQVRVLLSHSNNYVRCIGFLYLRYLLPPDQIWNWFEQFLDDRNVLLPCSDGKTKMTIGTYVESLIVEQKYYSTIFPRIPVPILRELKKKLLLRDRDEKDLMDRNHKISKRKEREESGSRERRSPDSYRRRSPHRKHREEKRKRHGRSRRKNSLSRERSRSGRKRHRSGRSRERNEEETKKNQGRKTIDRRLEDYIKERDKEDASAIGRNYANRPVSYKSCLSVPMQIMTTRQRSFTPPTRPSRRVSPRRERVSAHREKERKRPPSRGHKRKMAELKKIYGDASSNQHK